MILMIQNRIRGILARKEGEELRMKEMEFLGMAQKAKTQQEILNDPIVKMQKNCENRRMIRQTNEEDFNTAKELLKEEIANTEGVEISESMKKERRDWIQEYRGLHNGKPPADLKDFYNRFNVEPPLSPEEEEAKRLQEEEDAKAKKKKKAPKKKKKKGGDDEEKVAVVKVGPTEVV